MGRLVYVDSSGREVVVPFGPHEPLVTIGRAVECTIRSNQKSVSRKHAEFRYDSGQYQVADLGSSNGTFLSINNTKQHVEDGVYLTHDDEIWCGNFVLRFLEEDDYYANHQPLVQDSEPTYGEGAAPLMYPDADEGYHPPAQNSYDQGGYSSSEAYSSVPVNQSQFGSSSYPPPVDDVGYQSGANFNPDPLSNSGLQSHNHASARHTGGAHPSMEELQELRQELVEAKAQYSKQQADLAAAKKALDASSKELAATREARDQALAQQQEAAALHQEFVDAQEPLVAELDALKEQVDRVARTERGAELESLLRHNEELLKERDGLRRRNEVLEKDLLELRERIESYRRRATHAEEEAMAASKLRQEVKERELLVEQLRDDQSTQRESQRTLREELDKAQIALDQARRTAQTAEDLREELARARRLLDEAERRGRTLQKEKDEAEGQRQELEASLQAQSSDTETLKTLTTNYEKRISQLTSKNTALEKEAQGLRKSDVSRQSEHDAQRKELLTLSHDFKALKDHSSTTIAQLHTDLQQHAQDLTALQAEHASATTKLHALEPELLDARAEAEGLRQRLKLRHDKKAKREAQALAASNATLKALVDELQAKLEGQQARALPPAEVVAAAAPVPAPLSEEAREKLESIAKVLHILEKSDLREKLGVMDRVAIQSALKKAEGAAVIERLMQDE